MVFSTKYKRAYGQKEATISLKYRLAHGLVFTILFAIMLLICGAFLYPTNSNRRKTYQEGPKCRIPSRIQIPKSQDGSYTPPAIHSTLIETLRFVSNNEYQSFCEKYDPVLETYTDEWPYNTNGECGNWQEEYTKLHKRNMGMLEKYKSDEFPDHHNDDNLDNRPKFISYICKEVPKNSTRGCGGLADRMGGMISTFFHALLTDRAYLLNWASMNPLSLESVWERPHIDWSHNPEDMETLFTDQGNPYLGYQKVDILNRKIKSLTRTVFPDGGNTELKDLWNATYVEVRSNRGYIIRTFQISEKYKKKLNSMGLTKENTFRCITNYLFRPTIGARRFLNAYKSLFQMPSILSIGIQIRTDDHALVNPHSDQNGLARWGHFLTCAGELASFKKEAHHRHIVFFLVTDSGHLRDEFVSLNTNKELAKKYIPSDLLAISSMVITGLPIEHIEPEQIVKYIDAEEMRDINQARMLPGVNSAYMENWLLGETQYRVISIQGYGKMAAFYSGDDKTTISMPRPRLNQPFPVCNTDKMLTTFDWLSTQWSLG